MSDQSQCLIKDPKERLRDIGDVRLAMRGVFETVGGAPSEPTATPQLQVWQRPAAVMLTGVCTAAVAGLGVWAAMRPKPIPIPDVIRFAIVPPDTAPLGLGGNRHDLAISPDGTLVVYDGPGTLELNLRRINQLEGAPLRGTLGGQAPFVSPDGEWVGFQTSLTNLHKVSIFGGPAVALTESPSNIFGASWGTDDQIIFGTQRGGLFRVSAGGGEPETLTTVDTEQGETAHMWPFVIPGREAVVFMINTGAGPTTLTDGQLAVLDLATGDVTRLGLAGVSPRYVSTGHLVYAAEDGSVRAAPFDATMHSERAGLLTPRRWSGLTAPALPKRSRRSQQIRMLARACLRTALAF